MSEAFNEGLKKRQFIEKYYVRKPDQTPGDLMDIIGAPRRMLGEWISEPAFRRELDQIDAERVWLAKEVFFRKIGEVFETVASLAAQRGPNSIRAAEVMFKIAGLMKDPRQAAQPSEKEQEKQQGSASLDELIKQRDEIVAVLQSVEGEPPLDEEEADAAGSGDSKAHPN